MTSSIDTHGASSEIEAVVEGSTLPPRLRERVYRAIAEHDAVEPEHIEQIVQLVEAEYEENRVDPLEPVGTVSAQSIGEPGTQMSIDADEQVLIRVDGEGQVLEIGPFVDGILNTCETRAFGDHEVAPAPAGVEVLSLDRGERVRWKRLEEVSRHAAPDELLEITLESGRTIRATKDHSFVTRQDDVLRPIKGSTLTLGDDLPVVGDVDADTPIVERIPQGDANDALTDGGLRTASSVDFSAPPVYASWESISSIDYVTPCEAFVYDFSVRGLETFTTAQGVITHNTMNTFHYAGVAEIDVTQGLPRLIEIVDARKTPDTPTMKVYLEEEYAGERSRAHEVIWKIEATRILALGDVSTNVADMRVQINLNEETLEQREITTDEIAGRIEEELGIETVQEDSFVEFGPEQPSYRRLLQLVEELRDVVFKGLEDVSRVVVRKEENAAGEEEFVLYTEGSAYGDVLDIEGVDATRTTSNNIHEVYRHLGVEAAREAIINEMLDTLEEQALDDVNVRHLMLVADIMTSRGTIESIGRHGIAGSKQSVLARAAYEVTVNHLLDAAVHGEVDDLNGVIENVIVGKPIKLGTGDVDLRMTSIRPDGGRDA